VWLFLCLTPSPSPKERGEKKIIVKYISQFKKRVLPLIHQTNRAGQLFKLCKNTMKNITDFTKNDWEVLFYNTSKSIEKKVSTKGGDFFNAMKKLAELSNGTFEDSNTTESLYINFPSGLKLRLSKHHVGALKGGNLISLSMKSSAKLLDFQLNYILNNELQKVR
jgi:hypothetical protein